MADTTDDDLIRRGDALLPCPFCGAALEMDHDSAQHPGDDCVLSQVWIFDTNYAAWNTRIAAHVQPTDEDQDGLAYQRQNIPLTITSRPVAEVQAEAVAGAQPLVKLSEEFITAVWHLMDNSESTGPVDDQTITVWQPDFEEVSRLLDQIEGLPSGSTDYMTAGELFAANLILALTPSADALDRIRAEARKAEAYRIAEMVRGWRNDIPMTGEECADTIVAMIKETTHD